MHDSDPTVHEISLSSRVELPNMGRKDRVGSDLQRMVHDQPLKVRRRSGRGIQGARLFGSLTRFVV